jgi:lipid-A-disaccharide synthase
MKILVSAGETSGDHRGAEVLASLKLHPGVEVESFGLGGDRLKGQGMELLEHLDNYAVMGFVEILGSLGKFLALEKAMVALAKQRQPDIVLLVDYPGFNMRLGRRLRKMGFPVVHHVAPQMWAWGPWRVRKLRKSTDLLLTLFEFEEDFFRKRGVRAVFTGHPLKDVIEESQPSSGRSIALLPGSRRQEVTMLLPPMLDAYLELRHSGAAESALLALSKGLPEEIYANALSTPGVIPVEGTETVLSNARAALVCSGTATIETALHGVPFVVLYRTGGITYRLAKLLISNLNRIGMANIVAGEDVAPELIQGDVTGKNIVAAVKPFLVDDNAHSEARRRLGRVRDALGKGNAALNAAEAILTFAEERLEG